ncbi:hypothetical protein SH501x_001423 [Pirellulaceae bacterium SH501]
MTDAKTFFQVASQIARDIPDGYEIIIRIERDSGRVVLEDPFGDELYFPTNQECLQDEVLDALEFAIEHDREHHGEYFE